jgi:DnaK suppressor protein
VSKEKLAAREQEILSALKDIKDASAPVDLNQPVGRLSRMDLMQHQQVALANKKKFELNLELIKAAKARVESGEYGICLSCEEEISKNRLNAFPETPFCIKCAQG